MTAEQRQENPKAPGPEEPPSLEASVRDGVSYAVMMGSAETYFGPFGIFLQATTLPVLVLLALIMVYQGANAAGPPVWSSLGRGLCCRGHLQPDPRTVPGAGKEAAPKSLNPVTCFPPPWGRSAESMNRICAILYRRVS